MRRAVCIIASMGVLACAGAVAFVPTLKPEAPAAIALVMALVVIALGGRDLLARPRAGFWLILAAALLLAPATFFARSFGRVDMFAIAFHAAKGIEGASLSGLETELLTATTVVVLAGFAAHALSRFSRLAERVLPVVAIALVLANPFARFLVVRFAQAQPDVSLAEALVAPDIAAPPQPAPDLVIVYLEGVDRQFADEEIWGDIYAPLNALAARGVSFTRVGQIEGTGWSVAGMVATQCGVPLLPDGFLHKKNLEGAEHFLPSVVCLGDVLGAAGYELAFVVGAEIGFGGTRQFYADHGFGTLTGSEELHTLVAGDRVDRGRVGWMIEDALVLEAAAEQAARLMQSDRPFALVVETSGPHGNHGVLSGECSDSGAAEASDDLGRVVGCTVGHAVEFALDLADQHLAMDRGRDLRIVVLSDHLNHGVDLPEPRPELRGANTVIFVDGRDTPLEIERAGAMVDVYPTMLEWLGFTDAPAAAGIGRSLLSPSETFVEALGKERLDEILIADGPLAAAIWRRSPPGL